jgi:hypothetical protein
MGGFMLRTFARMKLRVALLIVFLMSICVSVVAQRNSSSKQKLEISKAGLFVTNSPGTESKGTDSILTFDFLGNSTVFFSASHDLLGLDDIACSPKKSSHYFVSHVVSDQGVSELLRFNAAGRIVRTIPFGSASGGSIALAFDKAGNFYFAQETIIFKNGVLFATVPDASTNGKLAVDSIGNLYLTKPISSQVFRVDSLGNVTLFADSTQGVNQPFGVAVDITNNIFVANNPPSAPAFILKFDQSGTASLFATTVEVQPSIRGMTFDQDGNLYATLLDFSTILKFDNNGNSSVFADASKGLDLPIAIRLCPMHAQK